MKYLKYFLFISLVAFSCKHEGPFDPTYLASGFKGITYTGEFSPDIIGPVDPSDWCYEGVAALYKTEIEVRPPVNFVLYPAYPNPVKYGKEFAIRFAIPEEINVRLNIIDNNFKVIAPLNDSRLQTGVHEFSIDTKKFNSPGIYRVVMETDQSFCTGDVWVQGN